MTTSRALVALACALLVGCGGPASLSAPRTAPVSGTVLHKGKPLAGVRVTFHPRFDIGSVKFAPSGLTGNDGRFTLSTVAAGDGAPAGLDTEVDAWKGKYADPTAGQWPATVGAGENELGPFRLD